MSTWTTLFAVATACWFFHFRSLPHNSQFRGWWQISMLLGASAYGFCTTVGLYVFFYVAGSLIPD